VPPPPRPSERYSRPPDRRRAVGLLVAGVVVYLFGAATTAVVLLSLNDYHPVQTAALGLVVALCVVIGRACLAASAAARGPASGGGTASPRR
jgi:hypothetical protein